MKGSRVARMLLNVGPWKKKKEKKKTLFTLCSAGRRRVGGRQSSGNEMIPVDSLSRDIFVFSPTIFSGKVQSAPVVSRVGRSMGVRGLVIN